MYKEYKSGLINLKPSEVEHLKNIIDYIETTKPERNDYPIYFHIWW